MMNYRSRNTGGIAPGTSMKRFFHPRSIGQRFALAIGGGAGAILIVLAVANFLNGRELLLNQASKDALYKVHNEIGNWDDLVERLAMLPSVVGATEVDGDANSRVTVPWLASLLKRSPGRAVYGIYMAREALDWSDPKSDVWVDRKSWPQGARLKYDFHDPAQDWYRGAKEKEKGIHVTLPYFDEGGSDIDMISLTKAVHDAAGKFIGVAGIDVSMEEMGRIVREMHLRDLDDSGPENKETPSAFEPQAMPDEARQSAYLISETGAVIVGPGDHLGKQAPKPGAKNSEKIMGSLADHGLPLSPEDLGKVLGTSSGWMRIGEHGDKMLCWAESRATGWKLLLTIPYSRIIAPARSFAVESLIIGGLGLLLLLGVVFYAAGKVSGPLHDLEKVAADFRQGFYEKGGDILTVISKRQDELGKFAAGFSAMAEEIQLREKRLSEWNTNLEQTVRDRTADLAMAMEKVEKSNRAMTAELAEAEAYSRAVLPGKLHGDVCTDWVFIASSQLGGDSFGYHWIDGETLALYLLDVCGHGVGAALLSVSVVNVLRTGSLADTDFHNPSAVLRNLNTAFPMEKHNEMYFTAWYGVYARSTGILSYASGGHPPAVLVTPEGKTTHLAAKGPVLGAFPKASYETGSTPVPPGSRLYLFSDGAYEIDRPDATMMTHRELSDILSDPRREQGLDAIVAEVRRQQGHSDFADDFSLVEFRFTTEHSGMEIPHGTLSLRADPSELARLHPFLKDYCEREGTPTEQVFDLEIILEELATNVMKYGGVKYGDACCLIELERKGSEVTIRFSDSGAPFNPLDQDEVDTHKPIEERGIGGLGIHFIKKLTDAQRYERRDGRNVLTLTKTLRG
jgi:serine phosphatase RsbU (regulator of sigma subunit)/anti-sigma regulatory factor (Ser/Thr protein kinase)